MAMFDHKVQSKRLPSFLLGIISTLKRQRIKVAVYGMLCISRSRWLYIYHGLHCQLRVEPLQWGDLHLEHQSSSLEGVCSQPPHLLWGCVI